MYQPSTPPSITPRVGQIALYYGLRAGLLLGIAQSVLIIYENHGAYSPYSALSTPLGLLLWVGAFLLAGYLAARQIGKTSTGTLTGLWTGMIAGIFTAGTLIVELIYSYGFSSMELLIAVMASYLTGLIFFVLFTMSAGCGLGALGGLIGQSFFARTPAPLPQHQQSEPPQQKSQAKQ